MRIIEMYEENILETSLCRLIYQGEDGLPTLQGLVVTVASHPYILHHRSSRVHEDPGHPEGA